MIYIVKGLVNGKDIIKVGDTSGSIAKRIDDLSDIIHNMELLYTFKEDHIDWFRLEKFVHSKFKDYSLRLKVKFEGYTEFYPSHLLKQILNTITEEKKNFYTKDLKTRRKVATINCPVELFYASSWINDEGKYFPVSYQCKALYMHHLSRYRFATSKKQYYNPTLESTNQILAIGIDKLKNLENLLFHMGLLTILDGNYIINDLLSLKGKLNTDKENNLESY